MAEQLKPRQAPEGILTSPSGIKATSDGKLIVPASRRPDGTLRPERRVKPGYRPPEDMQKYRPPPCRNGPNPPKSLAHRPADVAPVSIEESMSRLCVSDVHAGRRGPSALVSSSDKGSSIARTTVQKEIGEINAELRLVESRKAALLARLEKLKTQL